MSIKKEECTIHQTVYQIGNTAPLAKGKIAGPLVGNLIIVEWSNGTLTKVNIKTLMNEVDGHAENARLVKVAAELEAEFEKVHELVHEKLAAAAKLIDEANNLASKHKMDTYDMYDATAELMSSLRRGGWNTSSMSC